MKPVYQIWCNGKEMGLDFPTEKAAKEALAITRLKAKKYLYSVRRFPER
jgi:hypothetical protein